MSPINGTLLMPSLGLYVQNDTYDKQVRASVTLNGFSTCKETGSITGASRDQDQI